jgi:Family of unknown function (DUF5941)/CDP-alcohol phosphatidyltransferase
LTSGATETHAATRAPTAGPAAILLATAPGPNGGAAAAQPWDSGTLLGRWREQLAALGIADVTVIARPGVAEAVGGRAAAGVAAELRATADVASATAGGVLVAQAEVVTDRAAIANVLAAPAAALTAARGSGGEPVVQILHARVIAAASELHRVARPSGTSLGVLKAAGPEIAAAARRLADLDGVAGAHDALALLLVALVRGGVAVRAVDLRAHFWARPLSSAELERAREQHAHHDEDRARMDSAVKASDGFFTTFFVSPWSRHVARWAARRGIAPNAVTVVSMAIGLLAAAAFATGGRAGLIAGAVVLQVAFAADCVDGQMARYAGISSAFGAWLDSMFDRAKEYAVYAGLALGGTGQVWVLAAGALALQTFRHTVELTWAPFELESVAQPPLEDPGAVGPGVVPPPSGPLTWVKKVIQFPIGERFAVISLAAAVSGPHTVFTILLVWGGVAAAYEIAGRLARVVRRRAAAAGLRWAAAPALRAVEYGAVLLLAGADDADAAFAYLAAVALHQYDGMYRRPARSAALPGWVAARLVVVGALALAGALRPGLFVAGALIAALTVAGAATGWRGAQ